VATVPDAKGATLDRFAHGTYRTCDSHEPWPIDSAPVREFGSLRPALAWSEGKRSALGVSKVTPSPAHAVKQPCALDEALDTTGPNALEVVERSLQ
jgi:hypothetical protein